MSTSRGAGGARARLAAALGRPMPTKQVAAPCRAREAATVIISSAVYSPIAAMTLRLVYGVRPNVRYPADGAAPHRGPASAPRGPAGANRPPPPARRRPPPPAPAAR